MIFSFISRTLLAMTLLQLKGIQKTYGLHRVLDGVDLVVSEGQKIGLIGRNGAGKSTLLRIIAGQEEMEAGEIMKATGLRLGYLEQHEDFLVGETVLGYLERLSGKPEWQCAKIAGQFQLKHDRLQMEARALSGGYQMRVKLASVLLHEPDLLLLDEPTNYLDVQTQLLLEVWLQEYRGSFVIVSHDREFLKNVCTSTVEIERGKATSFPQGIEIYLAWKEEQIQLKERSNRSIEMQQKQLQTFIDRFRAKASKASQAQSKIKQLARLQTIDIEQPLKTVRIQIPQVEHRTTFALRTCRLAIGYGENVVANNIDIEIQRGERIAIVGENGKGKSTFLKTAAGVIPVLGGTCTWNNRLKVGYYAQQVHEALDPKDTIDMYLGRYMGLLVTREDVLRIASNFLFTQDDLAKPISVLSGGEKARLCLAGLLLSRPDVLLLDEPTNHLDMETVEALASSLTRWKGTIIFISHSRTFVHVLATALLTIENGTVKRDLRTYDEYVADARFELGSQRPEVENAMQEKREKQERYERGQELKRELRKIEKQLEEFSAKKDKMLKVFADKPMDTTPDQAREFNTIETVLAHAETEWLRVSTELQGFEA